MKHFLSCAVAAVTLLSFSGLSMAEQNYDFSDIKAPFITWPFEVVNVDISGEYSEMHHIYHVADSVSHVIEVLGQMFDKKQAIGKYLVMGITAQPEPDTYQVLLGYHNEHHYITIRADGSNTIIDFAAMPSSYISGAMPMAVYGFSMPDGATASVDQFTEE